MEAEQMEVCKRTEDQGITSAMMNVYIYTCIGIYIYIHGYIYKLVLKYSDIYIYVLI